MAKKQNDNKKNAREGKTKEVGRKSSRREAEAERDKQTRRAKITVTVFAITLIVAIVAIIAVGVVTAIIDSETVDVVNDNLGKYIKLSPEDYKSYPVTIKLDPIDVESTYIQALYKLKTVDHDLGAVKYPVADGLPRPIGVGDTVSMHYLGYQLGEGGEKLYFDGGCDFTSSSLSELGIGSGGFISGFETGLVGKNPGEYSTLGVPERQEVQAGDAVIVTLAAMYSDGKVVQKKSYTVVLDESCDTIWGEGFDDFLIGKKIGEKDNEGKPFTFTTNTVSDKSGESVYSDISIDKIYTLGDNPLTVKTYFPLNYQEPSLAGKTAYFDVYAEKVQYFNVPAVDEEFVTEKLEMTVEQLRAYGAPDASLDECYKAYIKENLEASANETRNNEILGEFWEYIVGKVKVKRLPRGDVNDYYQADLYDWTNQYLEKGQGASMDDYICTQLNLKAGSDWRAELKAQAEADVLKRIIFYYIVKEEGFEPNETEYSELYEQAITPYLLSALEQYKITEDKYDTKEKYDAEVAKYRQMIIDELGEDYINEFIIYEYTSAKIVEMAVVTEG